jgi:hypothetical protein
MYHRNVESAVYRRNKQGRRGRQMKGRGVLQMISTNYQLHLQTLLLYYHEMKQGALFAGGLPGLGKDGGCSKYERKERISG